MIKISGNGQVNSTSSTNKKSKTSKSGSSSFASFINDTETPSSGAVGGMFGVSNVDAILAAQFVEDATDEQSKKRLIQRGEDILDKLEEIRDGILLGYMPKERLMEIAKFVRSKREQTTNSRLATILDEIELRAEVEIAKLTS